MKTTMACAAAVLLLICPICNAQRLQPPTPAPWEVVQPPQQLPADKSNAASDDEIGTKSSPLFVKTIQSENDKNDENAARKHHDEEAANDRLTRIFTEWQLVVAAAQAGLFIWQLSLMRAATDAATSSANTAEQTLIAANRPWVSVSVALSSALTHTKDGWHIEISYMLKNVGNGPATSVRLHPTFMPVALFSEPDTVIELNRLCKEAMEWHEEKMGFGKTLFPGEMINGNMGLHGRGPLFAKAEEMKNAYSGQFHLLVCAAYGLTIKDSKHVTAKTFVIGKRMGADGRFGNIDLRGEQIMLNDLFLHPFPSSQTDYAT